MEEFQDRQDAGHRLASALEPYVGPDTQVLGMARGGVDVGFGVAHALHLPLHALVVRKLGAPHNPELAIGAVSETGQRWLDSYLVHATGATAAYLEREIAEQVAEARRRQEEYETGPGLEVVRGKPVLLIDDGIATGASALVGARSVRDLGASRVVLGTPVASRQAVQLLRPEVDALVTLAEPEPFMAVGMYYRNFDQTGDAEVIDLLRRAREERAR
jgi:putative phosphoribosyl transferase